MPTIRRSRPSIPSPRWLAIALLLAACDSGGKDEAKQEAKAAAPPVTKADEPTKADEKAAEPASPIPAVPTGEVAPVAAQPAAPDPVAAPPPTEPTPPAAAGDAAVEAFAKALDPVRSSADACKQRKALLTLAKAIGGHTADGKAVPAGDDTEDETWREDREGLAVAFEEMQPICDEDDEPDVDELLASAKKHLAALRAGK